MSDRRVATVGGDENGGVQIAVDGDDDSHAHLWIARMVRTRALAAEIVVMHQGAVLERGTPDAIQASPRVMDAYLG